MWHHDHFVLDVNDSESFIGGKVTIGDSVEDEWFLISLLFKIVTTLTILSFRLEIKTARFY